LHSTAYDLEILRRQRSNTNAQGLRMTSKYESRIQEEDRYTNPQLHKSTVTQFPGSPVGRLDN
jgi:hypothetical protein